MSGWKTPIPCNLNEIFGDNKLAKHVYIELLLRARTRKEQRDFNDTLFWLERGQCVCGRKELSKEFRVGTGTMWKTLKVLENRYNVIYTEGTPNGTIVTINNYDEVVKMDNEVYTEGTTKGQRRDTNKNIKNKEKEIYKEKESTTDPEITPTIEAKKYLEIFNLIRGTKFQATRSFEKNLTIWLKEYSLEDIKHALENIPYHYYWKDKVDNPDILLRLRDSKGNDCDRIGDLLNVKKPREITL